MLSLPSVSTRSLARRALDHMLAKIIRARLFIAPVLGSLALTFAFLEPTPWRRVVLATGVTLLFTLSLVEFLRYRRFGLSAVLVPVNVLLTVLGQLILLVGTGGLFSPVLPALLMMVVVTALLAERKTLVALLALLIPAVWTLALVHTQSWFTSSLLPVLFGAGQPLEHGPAPYLIASLFTVMLGVVARVGHTLQNLFESLFDQAVRERDRTLALHAEQNRVLTRMTAEIAHELKNPLASIKGLGALLAKDVTGKTAERLSVLRGEVDRMQSILDEFLNLSRPLVPLSLAQTNLHELAHDVVQLHEGSAEQRGVQLSLSGEEHAAVRCDARKVRQVLINLLQNALEASPRGSHVEIRVEPFDDDLSICILDRGTGLDPSLTARVFDVGVTSKEHGSGIGLAVARSLARQHGGDVILTDRSDGGVAARLRLPRMPPVAEESAA